MKSRVWSCLRISWFFSRVASSGLALHLRACYVRKSQGGLPWILLHIWPCDLLEWSSQLIENCWIDTSDNKVGSNPRWFPNCSLRKIEKKIHDSHLSHFWVNCSKSTFYSINTESNYRFCKLALVQAWKLHFKKCVIWVQIYEEMCICFLEMTFIKVW